MILDEVIVEFKVECFNSNSFRFDEWKLGFSISRLLMSDWLLIYLDELWLWWAEVRCWRSYLEGELLEVVFRRVGIDFRLHLMRSNDEFHAVAHLKMKLDLSNGTHRHTHWKLKKKKTEPITTISSLIIPNRLTISLHFSFNEYFNNNSYLLFEIIGIFFDDYSHRLLIIYSQ